MIHTLIIDDEADGRNALRIAIEKYFPEVSIKGIYETPEQGLEAIRTTTPDLVFLDVQMPHMSGFDLLKHVSPFNFEVIFVTAHDQYAIKAIRFSALDYLLKPVDIDDLRVALEKVKERLHHKNAQHQYQSVLHNIQHKAGKIERLAVPTQEGIEFFNTADIIFCEAEGSYTQLILTQKRKQLVSRNLKDFESLLADSGFCRVHHTYLINLRHVHKYIRGEGGYVIMTDNHHVDISRRKKEEFLQLLDKL
ncbi:response regulator transcription factor [Rhodocytophaga rosea]|uniref:Response regulator transcription factor n=1 Tax=Rhodocytophaga rosea TaxID=2704465 RepID=A0A6C0GSX8_9BACT|nr:LytTR family DNA-binding domain-containing protein [Rhodocytophaga rosea]QHT70580.1 response regulator transcription factor [Rhodocytophaga rosea]